METTTNPFAPPRTTDLDAVAPPQPLVLSDEALDELIAAAPWLRWLARVTSLSIAVDLIKGAVDVARGTSTGKLARLLAIAVGTAISTAILLVLRRYAESSQRLRVDPRASAPLVIATQAAYLRRIGALCAVGASAVGVIALVALIVFVATAVMR